MWRLFLFFAGASFIAAVIVFGVERISELLLPRLVTASYVIIGGFILLVYPLSRMPVFRKVLAGPVFLLGSLLASSAWAYALLFVMSALGIWGILCCFLFKVLTPIAVIGALFKGDWSMAGNLSLWIISSYLIKLFSIKLRLEAVTPAPMRDNVIDVQATLKE